MSEIICNVDMFDYKQRIYMNGEMIEVTLHDLPEILPSLCNYSKMSDTSQPTVLHLFGNENYIKGIVEQIKNRCFKEIRIEVN